MKKYLCDESIAGKRLDEAIFSLGITLSRSKAKLLLEQDKIRVNGKKEKASYRLELGDEILAEEMDEIPSSLQPEEMELDVIYEDEDILIINKPVGLLVHPGNGHVDHTLANALLARGIKVGDNSRPGIVHRIDKDTSGLLAIAKNEQAFASLSKQVSAHSMHRHYLALVKGIIYEDDGKIDAPIGRDDAHPTKNKVDVRKGKESVTYFHVEKRYRQDDVSLLSCRLLTGRTHQIRVHMEYIGHPVIGDPVYGSGNRKLYDKGQLLHAYSLTLTHPKTGKEMTFNAPLPPHFQKILDELETHNR